MKYKLGLKQLVDPNRELFPKYIPGKDIVPGVVDNSAKMPPVQNQGEIGSCCAFGSGKAFEYFRGKDLISKRALYSEAKHRFWPDDLTDDGLVVSNCLLVLQENYVLDSVWPYADVKDFADIIEVVPSSDYLTDYRFAGFASVEIQDLESAFFEHEVIVFGVDWQNSWFEVGADGRLPAADGSAGGHCFIGYGYDRSFENLDGSKGAILCQNSWGEEYGKSGCFFLPYNQLRFISDAYVVRICQ